VPAGYVLVEKFTSKRSGEMWFGQAILSDGREVIAKGAQLVTLLEQAAQDKRPLQIETEHKAATNKRAAYDAVIEVRGIPAEEPTLPMDSGDIIL
jgi:hypothetical protein